MSLTAINQKYVYLRCQLERMKAKRAIDLINLRIFRNNGTVPSERNQIIFMNNKWKIQRRRGNHLFKNICALSSDAFFLVFFAWFRTNR